MEVEWCLYLIACFGDISGGFVQPFFVFSILGETKRTRSRYAAETYLKKVLPVSKLAINPACVSVQ